MLKLATMIRNPGEPAGASRYDDPAELAGLGYNGRVLYETTALSGVAGADVVADAELRRWVEKTIEEVGQRIAAARAAGLDVYLFYDVLVLARDLVDRNVSGLTCKNRPTVLCPASEAAVQASASALSALIERWPSVAGIVLRFGDTDASRLPHLVGNDLYAPHCPRCSQFGRADRIVHVIKTAYDTVVTKHGKRLIVRAWNVRPNGMHDAPELAQRVLKRLPGDAGDDKLVLSFKFTQTDFWRYQPWNRASLQCGERPVIYELQCQREFEGKGGVPNWQAPLWRDGPPESPSPAEPAHASGLAAASEAIRFAGVLSWVRGGGWGGPFVNDESWIDANAYAAPRLADDPSADPADLAAGWLRDRLQLGGEAETAALRSVLERSPEMIRQGFYLEAFARGKADAWHPAADWISDDLLDAEAAWRIVQRLPFDKLDVVVDEKRSAAELAGTMRHDLQQLLGDRQRAGVEVLFNTLLYAESFFETLRDLLAGLVAYRRWQKSRSAAHAEAARRGLHEAQSHWNHHTQRHGNAHGTATPFREIGLWELTQRLLAELQDG